VGQTRSVRLHYTLPALADLSAILDYIDVHSPQGARRVQARIQALADLLLQHPHIGRRTSDPAIRRMTTTPYPYLVFYEITETEIIAHAVRHAARDPSGMPGSAEPFYAPHQLAELQEGYSAVNRTYELCSTWFCSQTRHAKALHRHQHRAADDRRAGGLANLERDLIRTGAGGFGASPSGIGISMVQRASDRRSCPRSRVCNAI
jgi:toxin ParE1/3/4